jgi:hypothetical protein
LITKGLLEVKGTHLYYEMNGSGYEAVLIHGFTLDYRIWVGLVWQQAGEGGIPAAKESR